MAINVSPTSLKSRSKAKDNEHMSSRNLYNCEFFFWPYRTACVILVPQPGFKPVPPAVEARSPNHWTTREFPEISYVI